MAFLHRPRWASLLWIAAAICLVEGSALAGDDDTKNPGAKRSQTDTETDSDQSRWAGHVGIGFYGLHAVPLPRASTHLIDPADPNSPFQLDVVDITRTFATPAIGIRYWFNRDIGLDVAVGFRTQGGSDRSVDPNGTRKSDLESQTSFLIHTGVPIVLGGGRHLSVQATPDIKLGFASGKWRPATTGGPLPPTVEESGFVLQVGARLGAEIFFGFIGIPELALDASLGAYLQSRSASVSAGNAEMTRSETGFTTTNFNSPWDFFTSSLAARYYF